MMSQHHEKGSPKLAPVPRSSGDRSSWQPPLQFEQCRDEHRCQTDGGLEGAGPLILTLGPLGSAAADRPCCSCGGVVAPAPAPETVAVLRGSRYLRPAQELLSEAVRAADLPGDDGEEAEKEERLEASAHHAVHRAAKDDADGVQAKLLGLLSEVTARSLNTASE